jgi:hypothetical protein
MKNIIAALMVFVLSFVVFNSTAVAKDGGFCRKFSGTAICQ